VWVCGENEMDLNDITYKINGAIFEVNRTLGAGFMESVYEKALMIELYAAGLKAESQVPIKVEYKGNVIGDFVADIVVEDSVILELKAVEHLQRIHEAQLLNYLKATGYRIGLLINFTHPKAQIKRMIFDREGG
jgi:GxxExxY protein